MRNSKLDTLFAALLILVGLVGVYASIRRGLPWYNLAYAISSLLLGVTFFSEPMRRWRRTIFWTLAGIGFFHMGIKSDIDLLRFGYKATGIAMGFIGLFSAVLTVMKRENVLPEI